MKSPPSYYTAQIRTLEIPAEIQMNVRQEANKGAKNILPSNRNLVDQIADLLPGSQASSSGSEIHTKLWEEVDRAKDLLQSSGRTIDGQLGRTIGGQSEDNRTIGGQSSGRTIENSSKDLSQSSRNTLDRIAERVRESASNRYKADFIQSEYAPQSAPRPSTAKAIFRGGNATVLESRVTDYPGEICTTPVRPSTAGATTRRIYDSEVMSSPNFQPGSYSARIAREVEETKRKKGTILLRLLNSHSTEMISSYRHRWRVTQHK